MAPSPAAAETWRAISGFENFYEVSDAGRVRSLARKYWHSGGRAPRWCQLRARILKPRLNQKESVSGPYVSFAFSVEGVVTYHEAHRLVLEAFVGPCPEGEQGRHLDGNPSNNHLENLKWGTPAENTTDKVRHGTMSQGSDRWNAKLTAADIPAIRAARASGQQFKEIAQQYGVGWTVIQAVTSGKSWKHV